MASRNNLFSRPRDSTDSADDDDEERPFLRGFASTSPRRPFSTSFYPTLYTRAIALVLALSAFIIFVVHRPHYTASTVFLSFAIARQIVVLGSHLGSQIIILRIEVVHPKWKGMDAIAQEKWIKRVSGLACDGVVLLGLLVSLAENAREISVCHLGCRPAAVTNAVILGFVAFGLLLLCVPDCGMPHIVVMVIKLEKPVPGVWKLTSSGLFGEPEEGQDAGSVHDAQVGVRGQYPTEGAQYIETAV